VPSPLEVAPNHFWTDALLICFRPVVEIGWSFARVSRDNTTRRTSRREDSLFKGKGSGFYVRHPFKRQIYWLPRRTAMSESTHPESMPLGPSFYSSEDQVALELASIVKFMRKDPDNLVFRRFERLNLYNLLLLQHRLAEYDEEISNLEKEWNGPALAEAIAKLEPLMKSYSEAKDPSRLFLT